jgi:hypothetical protein
MSPRATLIAVILLGLLSHAASAQPADTARPHLWFTAGLGAPMSYDGGIAGGFTVALVEGTAFYGLRYLGQKNFWICFGHCSFEGVEHSESDIALTYGYRYSLGALHLSAAAGASLVRGIHPRWTGTYPAEPTVRFTTVGIAVEGRITLACTDGEGIGLSLLWYGNVNPVVPYDGLLLSVHIGSEAWEW